MLFQPLGRCDTLLYRWLENKTDGIMPLHIIQDPLQDVPKTLQNIQISDLTQKSDCVGKYVKGKVVFKGPLVSREDRLSYILKTVIKEDSPQQSTVSNNTSISVMLFGGLAKDFSHHANQGDTVVLSSFSVSPSPTFKKDGLHPCNLHLEDAKGCVYVSAASAPAEKKSGANTTPKYTYVSLSELQHGSVVNVYAVVTFFKLPYPTRGTDYCSTMKLTDQSGAKVGCNIFCAKQDNHPKIFKTGDIIRLHRMKVQIHGGGMTLVTSWGWSAVTFDGTVGTPVVPRTTSKAFHFSEEDRRMVTELREWAASTSDPPSEPSVPLSAVAPRQFFNLTCQLLAKATMDSACTLLKVWDGSRCGYPLLTVPVEEGTLEGGSPTVTEGQNLIANVLAYDNHVEAAQALKPGDFLCIYNLHAVANPVTSELSFHLHGGTSYGRGIHVLPPDNRDVSQLKSKLQVCAEQMEDDMDLDDISWLTQLNSNSEGVEETSSVRLCTHSLPQVSLAQAKSSAAPPQFVHVRAQLNSYQPHRLYQCLKLLCPQCKAIEEVPDADSLTERFEEAAKGGGPCRVPWAVTVITDADIATGRKIALHACSPEGPTDERPRIVFVQGATFDQMCRLTSEHEYMVPVRSSRGRIALLDSMVPFLLRGHKRFYGCKQCSKRKLVKPPVETLEVWNERNISEALGVQLMQYVVMMKLQLDDGTDTLDTLLFDGSEDFFGVSADSIAHNQEAQDSVQQTMDILLPPDNSTSPRPWLDLCLCLYAVEENGENQVRWQIVNTHTKNHPEAP
ncbi:protection of telomeres protein 1 [Engraulis encrasicolus]|uniref:protection of telomeres protein 1 n=1 Tax=Engraulis encrasicolus TaxID=184585 RepID=UPI002FD5CA0E